MPSVELSAGTIDYEDTGGNGPPLVLLHGLMMDGQIWREAVTDLREDHRVVLPTLPLGAHRRPMDAEADLSLRGLGRIVAELLERLDLDAVTLVFNDWSAAQTMIADGLMDRVGRLVLTPCEAFDNYPPGLGGKASAAAAKLPGGISMSRRLLSIPAFRNSPLAFGPMTKRGVPDDVFASWLEPLRRAEIRRDLRKYAGDANRGGRDMLAATDALPGFDRPVLIAWAAEDKMMPPEHGRRLAELFPDSRHVEIADSYTLIPIDQPREIARVIAEFVRETEVSNVAS